MLWLPSHCGVEDNELVDAMADKGAKLPQEEVPVPHATAKARIRRGKWEVKHGSAEKTYGDR